MLQRRSGSKRLPPANADEARRDLGLFCSGVPCAFDRVDQHRLGRKLRASGLHARVVAALMSWLHYRVSQVVVAGTR